VHLYLLKGHPELRNTRSCRLSSARDFAALPSFLCAVMPWADSDGCSFLVTSWAVGYVQQASVHWLV